MTSAGAAVERALAVATGAATRPSASRMASRDQRGFVITLELIILLSVFGAVFLFGLSTFQEYVINRVGDFFGNKIYLFDSTSPGTGGGQLIGTMLGANQYEAPFVIYRDSEITPPPAALLSIRGISGGSFTTRMRVYYTANNCAGTAYMLNPGENDWGAQTFGGGFEPVSDLYALQGYAYAIGTLAATPTLYRVKNGVSSNPTIESYWDSETYPNGACDNGPSSSALDVVAASAVSPNPLATFMAPYWIPVTTNSITNTTTDSGKFGGVNAGENEGPTLPSLGSPADSQPSCPEGTAGCPGL